MKRPADRGIQMAPMWKAWNSPQTIKKEIRDLISVTKAVAKEEDKEVDITSLSRQSAELVETARPNAETVR